MPYTPAAIIGAGWKERLEAASLHLRNIFCDSSSRTSPPTIFRASVHKLRTNSPPGGRELRVSACRRGRVAAGGWWMARKLARCGTGRRRCNRRLVRKPGLPETGTQYDTIASGAWDAIAMERSALYYQRRRVTRSLPRISEICFPAPAGSSTAPITS